MIAVVGIMACVGAATAIIIGGGIAIVGTGASMYMGHKQMEQAQAIADQQMELQKQAQSKAENRAKAMKLVQERQAASSLLKSQQAVGGALLVNEAMAERAEMKANRIRMENGINQPKNKNSHYYGSPKV